jgi:hypothetical protein
LRYDYAVLSASNTCPSGTYRFSRRFDNEDSSNHNTSEGDTSPNVTTSASSGHTTLFFCFVPRGSGGFSTWSSALDGQIIFSAGNEGSLNGIVANSGVFGTDDEDDGNNDQFWSSAPEYTARMRAIVTGDRNTTLSWATDSTVTVIDAGTSSTCDAAYLQTRRDREFRCTYGHDGKVCTLPGWDQVTWAYDRANWLYCMF